MKLLANENFSFASVQLLRGKGIDVLSVAEDFPSVKDKDVIEIAIQEGRVILTHDRDYGELIFKDGYQPNDGVIYFRLKSYLPEEPALLLLQLLDSPQFIVQGFFTVIDSGLSFRQRKI